MAGIEIAKGTLPAGLSGLELTEDGTGFAAISDRGFFVRGRIERDGGVPVALVPEAAPVVLRNMPGAEMEDYQSDAEGLVLAPDGRIFVSFEVFHRVRSWTNIVAPATWMPDLPDVDLLKPNGGIEALALGPDGALYAMPERLVRPEGIPVYRYPLPGPLAAEGPPQFRYVDHAWTRAFHLPARGRFRPVGADFGPEGRLYLLERGFVAPIGFRSRVRRFTLGEGGVQDEEVIVQTPLGRHGNLEGLSVWRDGTGAIRLTMIGDDNGLPIQRAELVEYRLARGTADR